MFSRIFPLFFFLLILGIWLLAAAPLRGQMERQEVAPVQTVSPTRTARLTPTIDRLAAPPTVENPNQADEGSQLFWLHCQPCHGDRGQGLTDEWRAQYPPEDQNCWASGCHGRRPYEDGFTLPDTVPPVIGGNSLARFTDMRQVYAFISSAMPFQDPGHLSEAEYLAITAFLARAHGLWTGQPLDTINSQELVLNPEAVLNNDPGQETVPGSVSGVGVRPANGGAGTTTFLLPAVFAAGFSILLGAVFLWKRNRRQEDHS